MTDSDLVEKVARVIMGEENFEGGVTPAGIHMAKAAIAVVLDDLIKSGPGGCINTQRDQDWYNRLAFIARKNGIDLSEPSPSKHRD